MKTNTQTKEQWLKKQTYKKIIREEGPFQNATKRTIEFNYPSHVRIEDQLQDLAYQNEGDGKVDSELLSECIREEAYSLLKSNAKTFSIKYIQINNQGRKTPVHTEKYTL